MKLVIDIPEEIYIEKKEDYIGDTLDRAIANGIPLEEEFEKLKTKIKQTSNTALVCEFSCADVCKLIDKYIEDLKGENK